MWPAPPANRDSNARDPAGAARTAEWQGKIQRAVSGEARHFRGLPALGDVVEGICIVVSLLLAKPSPSASGAPGTAHYTPFCGGTVSQTVGKDVSLRYGIGPAL